MLTRPPRLVQIRPDQAKIGHHVHFNATGGGRRSWPRQAYLGWWHHCLDRSV